MSDKYIRLEDVINFLNANYVKEDGIHWCRDHNNDTIDKLKSKLSNIEIFEGCEDCISREYVLNAMKEEEYYEGYFNDEDIVCNAPSVVLSRPRGEWIGISYDGYADGYPVYDEWECSNCGYETEEETRYCPNCGADMRGDEE